MFLAHKIHYLLINLKRNLLEKNKTISRIVVWRVVSIKQSRNQCDQVWCAKVSFWLGAEELTFQEKKRATEKAKCVHGT